mmetsp:Transcript_25507/g.59084  ORF Transcript_25507/g.59084 Transcript_25507/m.59084 type:complete len:124 (+) Transcript_25507:643-1014(+)
MQITPLERACEEPAKLAGTCCTRLVKSGDTSLDCGSRGAVALRSSVEHNVQHAPPTCTLDLVSVAPTPTKGLLVRAEKGTLPSSAPALLRSFAARSRSTAGWVMVAAALAHDGGRARAGTFSK